MKLDKKEYILIGDNNFWYGICDNIAEARAKRKEILDNADTSDEYDDGEAPDDIYIYQSREVLD